MTLTGILSHFAAQEMRDAILAVYQARRNLAATLKDTKSVVGKLENLMGVVIHCLFFFFYLMIWNVSAEHSHRDLNLVVYHCSYSGGLHSRREW